MTIKTMLIIGGSAPGALENIYQRGLEKCGVQVDRQNVVDQYYALLNKRLLNRVLNKLSPDIFYREINTALLRSLQGKRYDAILVFKGMELFPDTVQQLKAHAALTANYNADHPFIFYAAGSGNQHVVNSITHYDLHFSYAKKIVQQLREKWGKQAYCIPFGYDGNIPAAPSQAASGYQERIVFIGAFDRERAGYLNRLQSDMIDIYGEHKWKTRNLLRPYVRKAYRNRALYGSDYTTAITTSLGVLNLIRRQNRLEDSHNMRTFEVPGYGGLLVSQRTGEQSEYFEENKEAVFFDSPAELKDKTAYLLAHPAEVRTMKAAAYSRSVRSGYSYDNRSRQLLQCLQHHF